MPTVRFIPEQIEVEVSEGATVLQAAKLAGISVYRGFSGFFNCGGQGLCGECRVVVLAGNEHAGPVRGCESDFPRPFKERKLQKHGIVEALGERLACQTTVHGPLSIAIGKQMKGSI